MMLQRTPDFEDNELPIISMCIITDRNRCPPNFIPILKTADDNSDADLWRDGFGFGIFNRSVRYIAINRVAPQSGPHEIITDLAIINEKEAVPTNFVCIDYTADTKERALKKKFICVRFTQRNDAIDALTDVIVLSKNKRPPKGYTSAGEVDGILICFKVATIPQSYGIKQNMPATSMATNSFYPSLNGESAVPTDLAQGLSSSLNFRSPFGAHCSLDGVPFKLNPRFTVQSTSPSSESALADPLLDLNLDTLDYNFRLERSIIGQP
ncbi:hypothetical protein M3Y97_00477400 [Aphelenchoides bicaudatus]|nr:hypothetical protein M3Y97_00477400 [Aphelenchoides bicaudatus]